MWGSDLRSVWAMSQVEGWVLGLNTSGARCLGTQEFHLRLGRGAWPTTSHRSTRVESRSAELKELNPIFLPGEVDEEVAFPEV